VPLSRKRVRAAFDARAVLLHRWRAQRHTPTVTEGIERLHRRFEIPPADDEPVFLLAGGWRSGSTLLQRMVTAAGQHLVWGEPYLHADLIGKLTASVRSFAVAPEDRHLLSQQSDPTPHGLSSRWIANLYPDPADLIEAHRALFRRLFAEPAHAAGFDGWGIKEVHYGRAEAEYLRLLFPRARMVFLHRSPYDAWYSFQGGHRGSARRWPDRYVWTARQFGDMWNELVTGLVEGADDLGALVVRYDDLTAGRAQAALETHLGLTLPADLLDEPIGSTAWGRRPASPLGRRLLATRVEPLAGRLDYR
jgi:hypothetical protein